MNPIELQWLKRSSGNLKTGSPISVSTWHCQDSWLKNPDSCISMNLEKGSFGAIVGSNHKIFKTWTSEVRVQMKSLERSEPLPEWLLSEYHSASFNWWLLTRLLAKVVRLSQLKVKHSSNVAFSARNSHKGAEASKKSVGNFQLEKCSCHGSARGSSMPGKKVAEDYLSQFFSL